MYKYSLTQPSCLFLTVNYPAFVISNLTFRLDAEGALSHKHSIPDIARTLLIHIDSKELKPSVVLQKASQTSFLKSQHNSLDVLK